MLGKLSEMQKTVLISTYWNVNSGSSGGGDGPEQF